MKALVHTGRLEAAQIAELQPMLLQDLQTVLARRQLVTEVFLRYYDLLSFAEMQCEKR